MKKMILTAIAALGFSMAAVAQDAEPNRMLVISADNSYKAFNIEHVSAVQFATVEGKVGTELKVKSHTMKGLTVECMRTDACEQFLLNVVPGVIAHQLEANPASAGSYLRQLNSPTYSEDFTNGEITGVDFQYASEYAVVTVGIDRYNVDGDVSAAYFTTENPPLTGNPQVEFSVVSNALNSIDVKITPNKDVKEFWYVSGEKGLLAQQYEQFAGMFGFANVEGMIKAWGGEPKKTAGTYTITDLNPNTDYELYIVCADVNGYLAPVQIFNMRTKDQGGKGEAVIDVEIGDFGLTDWGGEELPTQVVTYTPNDQTWAFRCSVYDAVTYDAKRAEILEELASEPPVPNMAYWFFYEPFINEYQVNTSTEYVAVAVGKNADGKWGKATEKRFTTPAVAEMPARPDMKGGAVLSRKDLETPKNQNLPFSGVRMIQK